MATTLDLIYPYLRCLMRFVINCGRFILKETLVVKQKAIHGIIYEEYVILIWPYLRCLMWFVINRGRFILKGTLVV